MNAAFTAAKERVIQSLEPRAGVMRTAMNASVLGQVRQIASPANMDAILTAPVIEGEPPFKRLAAQKIRNELDPAVATDGRRNTRRARRSTRRRRNARRSTRKRV